MQSKQAAGSTRRFGHVFMDHSVHEGFMTCMEDVMEKKTFAFRLADKSPRDTGKWQAREGVALASCTDARPDLGFFRYNIGGNDTGAWC